MKKSSNSPAKMKGNGNLINISGFTPLDIEIYIQSCLGRMPKEAPGCIKMAMIDEEGDELEHAWTWMEGESINGIHIRTYKVEAESDRSMSIFIPWMASGIDIYLAFAFMNAVAEKHLEAVFTACDEDVKKGGIITEITDEARDECLMQRLNIIAMLLELPEKFVNVPCMAGQWKMDLEQYRRDFKNMPLDKQVTKVLFDIVDFVWYQDHPDLEKRSEEYEKNLKQS